VRHRVVTYVGWLVVSAVMATSCSGSSSTAAVPSPEQPAPTSVSDTASDSSVAPTTSTVAVSTTLSFADRLPPLRSDVVGALETTTGHIVAVSDVVDDGWSVVTPCGEAQVVTSGRPIGAQLVVIDPGHGGDEPGAVGEGGLREADLNLAVARVVAERLAADGVSAILTRSSDIRLTLASRAAIARSVGARAFVSIHHNAAPDGPSGKPGTEVWYQHDDPESRRLSGIIYEDVVAALSDYDAEWVADSDAGAKVRLNSRGTDYYGILRESSGTPAALAELAFLSNPSEEQLLSTLAVQRAEGQAVAEAIERYLVTADQGSGFVDAYERVTPAGSGGGTKGCVDPALE